MGIIVNFTARTVQGFYAPGSDDIYPVKIDGENDVTVWFRGRTQFAGGTTSITGSIDRLTGDLLAIKRASSFPHIESKWTYKLKCIPTQRKF